MVLMTTESEALEAAERRLRTLEAEYEKLAEDYAGIQRNFMREQREVTRLRRELVPARQRSPRHKLLQELAAEWKHQTGHHRALVPLEGKRCQAINRALDLLMADKDAALSEAQAAQRIRRAFVGAGRYPFVVNKQRSPTGTESQRYDDVDTVLRDEKQIEKLISLADAEPQVKPHVAPAPPRMEFVHWQTVQRRNHEAIVKCLKGLFGNPVRAADGLEYWPCPRCKNDPALTLRVHETFASCSACGLDDRQMLRTLAERAS